MCADPFTMMMIASTAFNAMSKMDEGDQKREMYDYQAEQSLADAQAERELGEVRASRVRKAGKSTQSEALAALAASGVEVTAGTPVVIQSEIKRSYEEAAAEEILFGERKGRRLDADAALQRRAGENAEEAGYRGAFGSVLSGGAKLVGPGWKAAATGPINWGASGDFPDNGTVRIA